jgi:hypothetical protein
MVSFIFLKFHVYSSSKKRGGKRKERRKFASIWERLGNFATSIPKKIAAGAAPEVDSPRCARIVAVTFVTMTGSLS